MASKTRIAGVGMVPFATPSRSESYDVMGETAARAALADAGIGYELVEQAYVGYVYGDSTSGQKALYGVGTTGIPIINVNNNCATGSTALLLARQAVDSGAADCVLALGFEQMQRGTLVQHWQDRPTPVQRVRQSPTRSRARPGRAVGGAVLRWRGSRIHRALRHRPGDVRAGLGQVPPACRAQPVRGVP